MIINPKISNKTNKINYHHLKMEIHINYKIQEINKTIIITVIKKTLISYINNNLLKMKFWRIYYIII